MISDLYFVMRAALLRHLSWKSDYEWALKVVKKEEWEACVGWGSCCTVHLWTGNPLRSQFLVASGSQKTYGDATARANTGASH